MPQVYDSPPESKKKSSKPKPPNNGENTTPSEARPLEETKAIGKVTPDPVDFSKVFADRPRPEPGARGGAYRPGDLNLDPVPQFEPPPFIQANIDAEAAAKEGIGLETVPVEYYAALDARAQVLNPNLVAQYPAEAAALLTSGVPTEELAKLSNRVKDGLDYLAENTSVDAVPFFLVHYYEWAFNAPTPERRAQALAFLDKVRTQPPDEMYAYLNAHMQEFDGLVRDYTAVGVASQMAFGPVMAGLGGAGKVAMTGATLPLGAASLGAKTVGLDELGEGLENVRHGLTEFGGDLPTHAGKAIRLATGIPAAAVAIGGRERDEHGNKLEGRYTPLEAWQKYAWGPSFGNDSAHAGITTLLMESANMDPTEWEQFAQVLDLGNDLIGGWFVMEVMGGIKAGRGRPVSSPGGAYTGAEKFAPSGGLGETILRAVQGKSGRRLVNEIWDVRNAAVKAKQPIAQYLQDNIKGRMPDLLAERIAAVETKADVPRAIANYADQVPTIRDFDRVHAQLRKTDEQLRAYQEAPAQYGVGEAPIPEGMVRLYSERRISELRTLETEGIKAGGKTTEGRGDVVWAQERVEGINASRAREGTLPDDVVIVEYWVPESAARRVGTGGADAVQTGAVPREQIVRVYKPGEGPVGSGASSVDPMVTDLLAHRAAQEQMLLDLNARLDSPLWEWPRVSPMKAAVYDAPSTSFGKLMNVVFRASRKVGADPLKLVNDLSSRDLRIYNPTKGDRPAHWAEHNTALLQNYLRRARVKPEVIRGLLDDMGKLKNSADYMEWRTAISDALKKGLSENGFFGRKRTTPEMQEVIEFTDHDALSATYSSFDEMAPNAAGELIRENRPVLEDLGTRRPLPSQGNEVIGHTMLADLQTLAEAKSALNYFDAWARAKPFRAKIWGTARMPVDVTRLIMLTLPRMIMKPLLFITRQVPMGTKIQLDQGLRLVTEGMSPLPRFRARNLDQFPGGVPIRPNLRETLPGADPTVLGTLKMSEVLDGEPMRIAIPTRNIDLNSPLTAVKKNIQEVTLGTHEALMHVYNDPFARMVAQRGAAGTLEYIRRNPTSDIARTVDLELMPGVQRAGLTIEEFLARKEAEIVGKAGGIEAYRQAMATGRLARAYPDSQVPPMTRASAELRHTMRDMDKVRELETRALAEGDSALALEAARRWEQLDRDVVRLSKKVSEREWLDLADQEAISRAVLEDWSNGRYQPPSQVYVTRRAVRHTPEVPKGFVRRWEEKAGKASDTLYSGLRPLTWADIKLTRGSAFFQHFERTYGTLIKNGYTAERAFAVAQYRAAFLTRDLMYDLSARSSFDRAMRDHFWFSPVLREQLTTWLYKIPSRSYWPIGIATTWGTAHNLVADLTALGILHRDDSGELVARLPFISNWAGHLIGQPVEFRFDGINPVTPGGTSVFPTLSPGMEKLLELTTDHAPKELVPFLKDLSKVMTFDQGDPGANFLPNGIQTALEAFGINVPYTDQYNPTMWHQANALAEVQAMQYAMSEMRTEGILPPAPGAPVEEWDKYRETVESRAKDYEGGLAWTRFIGGLLSPMSVITTPKAAAKYYAWREKQGMVWPYTEENYAAIDAYVREHPEALPYTIGKYGQADEPLLPDKAPFAEKLAAGDLYPLGPDGWFLKSMVVQGFAAEEARLNQELRAAGVGKDANARLSNWDVYTQVTADHLLRLDKWFNTNPEIEAYLKAREDSDLALSQTERLALEANRDLKMLQRNGVFKDLSSSDLGIVRSAIARAYEDVNFGDSEDPVAAEVGKYFDDVMDPYRDAVDPLYEKVNVLFASGQDDKAFKVLNRIRLVNNEYNAKAEEMGLPGPEEFSYNSKTNKDQRTARLDWTLSSPTTLTDFQTKTVGLPDFPGREFLQGQIAQENERFFTMLADPHLTDDGRDAAYARHDATVRRLGAAYGIPGITYARLAVGTPADRLSYTGFGSDSFYWNTLMADAASIINFAESKGVSPRYASETSGLFAMKVEFERRINFFRAIDPTVDRLFRSLSKAAASHGEDFKLGVPLYEHVFFGQTQNAYNYQDPLVAAVERANLNA